MALRVLVARAELLQTRAVTRWEDGEVDGRLGRRLPTLSSYLVASPTAALIMPRHHAATL